MAKKRKKAKTKSKKGKRAAPARKKKKAAKKSAARKPAKKKAKKAKKAAAPKAAPVAPPTPSPAPMPGMGAPSGNTGSLARPSFEHTARGVYAAGGCVSGLPQNAYFSSVRRSRAAPKPGASDGVIRPS